MKEAAHAERLTLLIGRQPRVLRSTVEAVRGESNDTRAELVSLDVMHFPSAVVGKGR